MQLGWLLQKWWTLEAAGGGGGFKLPTPLPREEKKRKRKKQKPKTFWGECSLSHHTSRHWSATRLEKRSAFFVVKDKKALIGVGYAWGVWRDAGTGNFDARDFSSFSFDCFPRRL